MTLIVFHEESGKLNSSRGQLLRYRRVVNMQGLMSFLPPDFTGFAPDNLKAK
jgi:hypothetical protein